MAKHTVDIAKLLRRLSYGNERKRQKSQRMAGCGTKGCECNSDGTIQNEGSVALSACQLDRIEEGSGPY